MREREGKASRMAAGKPAGKPGGRPQARRGGHRGGRRPARSKPRLPPEVHEKVKALQTRTGLPFREALSVVRGKATVQQVLLRLMKEEKLKKLVAKGELDPMFVPAVLGGTMALDRAKYVTRLLRDEAWRSTGSILEDLKESGDRAVFFLFGRQPFEAAVSKMTKYDVWLQREGEEEPEETQKHNIIYVCRPEEKQEFLSLMDRDEEVVKLGLGASTSYQDRFRSTKEALYELHRKGTKARVTFRDGSVLVGRIGWFGKWEFQLEMAETCRPVVFRHAMYALEAVEEE